MMANYERDVSKETYEQYVQRVSDVYVAVVQYLSHLAAFEQGAEHDSAYVDQWRAELERLTGGDDE